MAAFEEPVTAESDNGHLREASARLAAYLPEIERAYGDEEFSRAWVLRIGSATEKLTGVGQEVASLTALVETADGAVTERMEKPV